MRMPGVFRRAFADDVGLVLSDCKIELPQLARILDEFGTLSSAKVDVSKTVRIPLTAVSNDEVRPQVVLALPGWATLPLENTAKRLGLHVGPAEEEPR
jgi:hypothetical protein